jgi:predicted Zn-ribbon and HTH transcriptional regulator
MPQRTVVITINVCCRCGREWTQRKPEDEKPVRCPACRSPYWDTPRRNEVTASK